MKTGTGILQLSNRNKSMVFFFATKAPKRPNAIGVSPVKLIDIERNTLTIEQVDILNGKSLIDIKPFYPRYDNRRNVKIGWFIKPGYCAGENAVGQTV